MIFGEIEDILKPAKHVVFYQSGAPKHDLIDSNGTESFTLCLSTFPRPDGPEDLMWDFGIWGFRFDKAGQRASRPFRGRLFALSDARLSVDDVKRHQDVAWAPDGIGNLTQTPDCCFG